MRGFVSWLGLASLLACGGPATPGVQPPPPQEDGGVSQPDADAGQPDAGSDAGAPDGGADAGLDAGTPDAGEPDAGSPDAGVPDAGPTPGWYTLHEEHFESLALPTTASWARDTFPDDGPFSDNGLFFRNRGVTPPAAYRASVPFGESNWLTAETYTRAAGAPFDQRLSVVVDPANPNNHALRLASPAHTDATVIRSSIPLPARYRVSLRIGFADFGDGKPPPSTNGYDGNELAEPWLSGSAMGQNGFYWITILDSQPRPHNNVWIHHHRKVVMDSDNNTPPWMEMFDGNTFSLNGQHPLMMIALDGRSDPLDLTGPPFYSYSNNRWQPSGDIRAVDAYLPGEWYTATVERDGDTYTLSASGRFKYGGIKTYTAVIDAAATCVWHYNNQPGSPCSNNRYSSSLGSNYPNWPATQGWPDWFMFGDPHENFYEGSVLYDDIKLEAFRD